MPCLRFGGFEFDPDAGELRRDGELVKIQPQPAKVLAILASRPGSLVTRDQLRAEIWGVQTFVDFDRSLNFAVAHIRAVLGDSAEAPKLIQTVPRRGYRFIGSVEETAALDAAAAGHNGSAANSRKSFRPFVAVCLTATLVFVLVSSLVVDFEPRSDIPDKSPVSGANQAFVDGQYLLRKATRHDLSRALDRFKKAAALDSGLPRLTPRSPRHRGS